MSKEGNEFKWTDELVKEFAWRFLNNFPSSKLPESIEEFKQSKQPKREREWEIVSFEHSKYGILFKHDDRYFHHVSGYGEGWCLSEENALESNVMVIHSVKRLSDSETFTVGDEIDFSCDYTKIYFPIERFTFEKNTSIFVAWEKSGCGKDCFLWIKPKPVKSLSCNICGGLMVEIRGRYPKDERRMVCPTCATEKLESIFNLASPFYGQTFKEKIK